VNNIDWRYLQQPLIIFIFSVMIATSMGVVGYQYESTQIAKYDKAVETLSTTYTLYINMVNDIDLLEQYRNLYSGYKSSGLVGEERRLSWIESLENTNKVLRLPTLSYSLMPQEKFIRPGLKVKSGVELSGSAMELTMDLLHEEDILAVLEGLRLSIKNLFTVESCSLRRSSKVGVPLNTKEANLRSICTIRWVTIDVK
jgi:hypothetical protein